MRIKNEHVLKAYERFQVDAVNLSSRDLGFISKMMSERASAQGSARPPLFERMVSASIVSESRDKIAPQPFIVREVPDRQNQAKSIRIAFLGLTAIEPAPRAGFKVADPIESARRHLPEAKKRADIVIALAHISTAQAALLARQVPGIDVIIAGNGEIFTSPIMMGKTLIVFTPFETRKVGELRFYRDSKGALSIRDRYIVLDEAIPDDPAATLFIAAADEAENAARAGSKKLLEEWAASTNRIRNRPRNDPSEKNESAYISSSACYQCHAEQYLKWANSAHARASGPVVLKPAEFDSSCLDCHATGLRKGAWMKASDGPQLQNVQCEECHGPGGEHAAKPAKGYGLIRDVKASCGGCHTPYTSPGFDFQTYWEKIRH